MEASLILFPLENCPTEAESSEPKVARGFLLKRHRRSAVLNNAKKASTEVNLSKERKVQSL